MRVCVLLPVWHRFDSTHWTSVFENERETIKPLLIQRQINLREKTKNKKLIGLRDKARREKETKRQRRAQTELSFHFYLFNKP